MNKSRTGAVLSFILHIISIILIAAALFADPNSAFGVLTFVIFIVSEIWLQYNLRCPYCRRYALGIKPFAKNAGYCRRCGKLVEYDF